MSSEKKKLLTILSVSLLLIGGVVYAFTKEASNTVENVQDKKAEKIDTFKVGFIIKNGTRETSHSARVAENSSIYDLLEILRKGDKLTYNLTNYSEGEIIESINNLENNPATKSFWNLYINDKLFNGDIRKTKVEEGFIYKLSYEQK